MTSWNSSGNPAKNLLSQSFLRQFLPCLLLAAHIPDGSRQAHRFHRPSPQRSDYPDPPDNQRFRSEHIVHYLGYCFPESVLQGQSYCYQYSENAVPDNPLPLLYFQQIVPFFLRIILRNASVKNQVFSLFPSRHRWNRINLQIKSR